ITVQTMSFKDNLKTNPAHLDQHVVSNGKLCHAGFNMRRRHYQAHTMLNKIALRRFAKGDSIYR
ncbi:MAG: hypothetical protein LBH90_09965, partial [Tannerella sp.]|nr:hypothetical protein [Tannerella sp.]